MSRRHSKSASVTATNRLRQDYLRLCKDPLPLICAHPLPSNILEWRYVVLGPEKTPYEGGYYHGKLVFPHDYPFKPPSIYMLTPNGRFRVNTRLCLSISDFHPDTWNPAWSVPTILTGLLSFMTDNSPTHGSIDQSDAVKRHLAVQSWCFNLKDKTFCELFPDLTEDQKTLVEEAAAVENARRATTAAAAAAKSSNSGGNISTCSSNGGAGPPVPASNNSVNSSRLRRILSACQDVIVLGACLSLVTIAGWWCFKFN